MKENSSNHGKLVGSVSANQPFFQKKSENEPVMEPGVRDQTFFGETMGSFPSPNTDIKAIDRRQSLASGVFSKNRKDSFFKPTTIQPKLTIGQPNDQYETEADDIAEQVVKMPDLSKEQFRFSDNKNEQEGSSINKGFTSQLTPTETIFSPISDVRQPIQGKFFQEQDKNFFQLENQINNSKGGGVPMDRDIQSTMGQKFGADFSGVRIHTGVQSTLMNDKLGAKAFTVGNDIHFNQGQYDPASFNGKRLLAHELTHTLQQAAAQPNTIQSASKNIVQLRTDLGYHSWTSTFMGRQTIHRSVIALTQQEWEARLRNLDEESEYREVQGFLECAISPGIANQTSHPFGWPDYVNHIDRAPNREEILDFMRALYSVGSDLDLPDGGWGDEGGPFRLSLREQIATLISRYQGFIIQEFSEQGNVIPEANVAAIVDETNADYVFSRGVMMSIINNAGATAMKALDMAVTANNFTDQLQRETSLATAYEMVRNAGRTIRYAITQETIQIQFNQAVVSNIFDTVWGTLPGGGALTGVAKDLLKLGLKTMLEEASEQEGSTAQAEALNNGFVRYANQLVRDGHTTSAIIQPAINGFEAVRR
jgi:hypothetical protein